jgi:hypothetical protein
MTLERILLVFFCVVPGPLAAQTPLVIQIGGGTCSSETLNGTYSLSLEGRNVSSSGAFTASMQGIGTATFDGKSQQVVFVMMANTNQSTAVPLTWGGTYGVAAGGPENCATNISFATPENAAFTLGVYNNPTGNVAKSFVMAGQGGVTGQAITYSFAGSGSAVPASCTASTLNGAYAFKASAVDLSAGSISGVGDVAGLLQFDGESTLSSQWSVSGGPMNSTTAGQYSVASGCSASATMADAAGTAWTLFLTLTGTSDFVVSGVSNSLMFIGAGHTL